MFFLKITLNVLIAAFLAALIWILVDGGAQLQLGPITLGLRNPKNIVIYLVLLSALRIFFFSHSSKFTQIEPLKLISQRAAWFFILAVISVKSLVSLTAVYYFKRVLDSQDLTYTLTTDLMIAGGLALTILILNAVTPFAHGIVRVVFNYCRYLLSITCILLGCLYVFLGYTYFEWGSYLEPQHFQAIRMAGVGPEFADLFFRARTLVAFGLIIGLWLIAGLLARRINRLNLGFVPRLLLTLVWLAPAAYAAQFPLNHPKRLAPSVQSPLMMLVKPVSGNSNGTDTLLIHQAKGRKTDYYPPASTTHKYQNLAGLAKGKNIIYYVMESVRRQNVPLYGYERDTMPFFTSLAKNSVVFDKAYVMQPRSSKAMTALALGAMPDPRLKPLSWQPERVQGKDSVFNRWINEGRRFYLGTAQPYGGDSLQVFFNATANGRADQITAFEQIEAQADLPNDDSGLSLDFLNWTQKSEQPFVGLLWTECAHMPYVAELKPFGNNKLIDRYDNCLNQVDRGLETLVSGLKESGQLNDTLIVILGDHGEALGEKFDRGHGSYLYQHSLRVPLIIYNPELFPERIDISTRFQLKDLAATVLYLTGDERPLNQSVNIFGKADNEELYFSNVYQDFKLGFMRDQMKFVYRPSYDISYAYDLSKDPGENTNIINEFSADELRGLKLDVLSWYVHQTRYIEKNYPAKK